MAPQSKVIEEEEVVRCRYLFYSWNQICSFLNVQKNTLQRWRHRVGFVNPLESVPDEDLDIVITEYSHNNRGEVTCRGHFRSLGIYAPRRQVRESINRVDYVGRQKRKEKKRKEKKRKGNKTS